MKKIILIIDDERAIHSAFELALEDKSYSIISALNGIDGIDKLKTNKDIEIIFLDLKMPGLNGVETLKKIREFNATIPVRIITAFAEEYMLMLKEAAELGLEFELVRKPLERQQILELMDSIFEGVSTRLSSKVHSVNNPKFILRLYVAGKTKRSVEVIRNVEKVCNEHLNGDYKLEVIDIFTDAALADGDQIIATPTLVKILPLPIQRVLGDLSKEDRVLVGLDLKSVA